MTKRNESWTVHVFRPGPRALPFCKIVVSASTAESAKDKAKTQVYKWGKLAHFYTYAPVLTGKTTNE